MKILQKKLRAIAKQSKKAGRATNGQQTLDLARVIASLLLLPTMDRSVHAQLLVSCLNTLLSNQEKCDDQGLKSNHHMAGKLIAQVIVCAQKNILATGRYNDVCVRDGMAVDINDT